MVSHITETLVIPENNHAGVHYANSDDRFAGAGLFWPDWVPPGHGGHAGKEEAPRSFGIVPEYSSTWRKTVSLKCASTSSAGHGYPVCGEAYIGGGTGVPAR